MAHRPPIFVRVLIIVLLLGGGYYWWQQKNTAVPNVDMVLYGNVDIRQVDLAFRELERIRTMQVKEGDRVKRGQLLATQETVRLAAEEQSARSQVDAQVQVLARLEAGSRPQEIRKAKADVEAALALAREAELTFKRIKRLTAQKAASEQDLDQARAAKGTAEARVKAAKETLNLAVVGPRKEDIAEAAALLARYRAQLALVRQRLGDLELYAPRDGVVQERVLEPGDMGSPDRPVYTLALTQPIWVRAYASETELGLLKPGLPARVYSDSRPAKPYRGWVGFVSPTAEFTPKPVQTEELRTHLVYQVRVFVCNDDNGLRLGMPATVRIDRAEAARTKTASPNPDPCGAAQ